MTTVRAPDSARRVHDRAAEAAPVVVGLRSRDEDEVGLAVGRGRGAERVHGPGEVAERAVDERDPGPLGLEVDVDLLVDAGELGGAVAGGEPVDRVARGVGRVVPAGERRDDDRIVQHRLVVPSQAHAAMVGGGRLSPTRGGSSAGG